MRILAGWDNPKEAELLSLYLELGDDQLSLATDPAALLVEAQRGPWDVILLALNLPNLDGAFEVFQKLRRLHPECPIVGACHGAEVFRMARFMTGGMKSYIVRDGGGDFVFLLHATLTSAVESVRAEREQKIAERLREEIESVRKLQESIIPRDLHCPAGYRICARYEPSQIQVVGGRPVILAGGDYYDVFALDDQSVVILVGDASGHGMKACMSIITMHTLVRMIRGQQYRDTAAFVSEVNRRLCEQSILKDDGGFITLFYAILRADRNEFQWTSAGHPYPLLDDRERGSITPIGKRGDAGLPLGVYADVEYESFSVSLPRHSRLLLYTDGLVEAFPEGSPEHQEYGLPGVLRTLERCRRQPLTGTLQALFDDSFAHTDGTGRHDDTSIVLLERGD
jgi:serine phosphatase RsbU (regulator of sigma subunit)/CheY-like chemotaxis protein